MFENIKEQKGTLYRGSIPFMLINKNKKIIYISSSNKNINDYYFSIGDFSDIKKYRIENYNYSVEEFRGKNYELIQFLEENEKAILFLSVDSLFKTYFKKGNSINLEKGKNYKISQIKTFRIVFLISQLLLKQRSQESVLKVMLLQDQSLHIPCLHC